MRHLTSSTQTAVTLVGSTLVASGSMLPWLRIDPAHEAPTTLVHYPGMESGLELWGLLLVPAVLFLGALHGFSSRPAADLATLIISILPLATAALYWQQHVYGYYVSASGWYVTVLGGGFLFVVGVERVWARFGYRILGTDDPRSV